MISFVLSCQKSSERESKKIFLIVLGMGSVSGLGVGGWRYGSLLGGGGMEGRGIGKRLKSSPLALLLHLLVSSLFFQERE